MTRPAVYTPISAPVGSRFTGVPTGLGTSSLRLAPAPPEEQLALYGPEPVKEDPALAAEVNRRLIDWAENEVELYPPALREKFAGCDFGSLMTLAHPDYATVDHLVAAGRVLVAGYAADDYYCEYGQWGQDIREVATTLAVCLSAADPAHIPEPYETHWSQAMEAHPCTRAYRSAMGYLEELFTPAQAERFRSDTTDLFLGYAAEPGWVMTGRVPRVWEYLTVRQINSFRVAMTLTDAVAGYELDQNTFAAPPVRRATNLASTTATLVNDLASLAKDLAEGSPAPNLTTVIAAEEHLPVREAFAHAVEIHNTTARQFEQQAAALKLSGKPALDRYLDGLWNWMGGCRHWHTQRSARYAPTAVGRPAGGQEMGSGRRRPPPASCSAPAGPA